MLVVVLFFLLLSFSHALYHHVGGYGGGLAPEDLNLNLDHLNEHMDRFNQMVDAHIKGFTTFGIPIPSQLPTTRIQMLDENVNEEISDEAREKMEADTHRMNAEMESILSNQAPSRKLLPPIPRPPILNPTTSAPVTSPVLKPSNPFPTILPPIAIPPILVKPTAPISYSFSCQTFPEQYSPYRVCSGVVDYSFYVPTGTSLQTMEIEARYRLANLTYQIGSTCLSNMKKLVCAQVYMPCVPGVVSGEPSTYSKTTGYPYFLPCQKLCRNVAPSCASYADILLSEGYPPYVCVDILPLTGVHQYDSSDNPDQCNMVISTYNQTVVSEPIEPYVGTTCKGIITELLVPNGPSINVTAAPLLPPYQAQALIEGIVGGINKRIPCSFDHDCLQAQRKLFCFLGFLKPQYTVLYPGPLKKILKIEAYIPRLPSYYMCAEFRNKCAKLVSLNDKLQQINCTMYTTLRNGANAFTTHRFPKQNETIAVISGIDVVSSPNNATAMYVNTSSACPRGFSVPQDFNAPGQLLITNYCAMNCPSPIFLPSEQKTQAMGLFAMAWINTMFGSVQFTNLMVQHPERKNKLITIIVISGLSSSLYDAFQRSIVGISGARTLVCASETEWHTVNIPSSTTETGRNAILARSCNFFALLELYMEFILYWCALSVFIELWLRVVLKVDHLPPYRKIYFFLGMLLAVGNAMFVNFYGDPKMISPGGFSTQCNFTLNATLSDFYLRYLPHIVAYIIALILGISVGVICMERSYVIGYNHEDNPLVKLWHKNSILFYYLILFIVCYGPLDIWFGYYLSRVTGQKMKDGFIGWIQCVFTNFVTPEDQQLIDDLCGVVPPDRITEVMSVGVVLILVTYNVCMVLITLDKESMDFWNIIFSAIHDFLVCKPVKCYVQDPLAEYSVDDFTRDGEFEDKLSKFNNGSKRKITSSRLDYSMYRAHDSRIISSRLNPSTDGNNNNNENEAMELGEINPALTSSIHTSNNSSNNNSNNNSYQPPNPLLPKGKNVPMKLSKTDLDASAYDSSNNNYNNNNNDDDDSARGENEEPGVTRDSFFKKSPSKRQQQQQQQEQPSLQQSKSAKNPLHGSRIANSRWDF